MILIYVYLTLPDTQSKVVKSSPCAQKVKASISSWVTPNTFKAELDASLLRAQHKKVRPRDYGRFTCCFILNVTRRDARLSVCAHALICYLCVKPRFQTPAPLLGDTIFISYDWQQKKARLPSHFRLLMSTLN